MIFGLPKTLPYIGLTLLLLALFLWWALRTRLKLISLFVSPKLQPILLSGFSLTRQKIRLLLLFFGIALLLIVIARPQMGVEWTEARQQGIDILVAIDTSKSMLAGDVTPDRLTRAKLSALDLVKVAKSDRVGLIAFAGSAFLQCPLTIDEEAFRQSIAILDTSVIGSGGTAISEAIRTAVESYGEKNSNHKALIIFTDGEDHDSGVMDVVKEAVHKGIRIFTIGVGTPQGELIRLQEAGGQTSFLKDEDGNVIKSRLNESLLQQVATATGGFYLPLKGANPMETLYSTGLATMPRSSGSVKFMQKPKERYHGFLALGLVALLAEMFWPDHKREKRMKGLPSSALLGLLLVMGFSLPSAASPTKAYKDYQENKFEESQSEYQRLAAKNTNDLRYHFNAGTAAYKANEIEQAERHFRASLDSHDINLQEKAYYNLGNTLFKKGEPEVDLEKKKAFWQESVTNYTHALELDRNDTNAAANVQYVKNQLEVLKRQLEQQKQEQKKNGKGEKSDSKDQKGQKSEQKDNQKQDSKQDQQKGEDKKSDPAGDQKQEGKGEDSTKKEDPEKNPAKSDLSKKGDKEEEEKKASSAAGEKGEGEEQQKSEMVSTGRMTPKDAMRLLEINGQEEKALRYQVTPKDEKNKKRTAATIKDW
jgi:Ca-activated chloride channel family protein